MRRSAAAVVFLLSACGTSGRSGSGYTARDSAGVEIVENAAPPSAGTDEWVLSSAPLLQIGLVEGDSAYQLFRVSGARRLSDGRIVVANGGTRQLRFFDRQGRFLRSSGGQGGGPGEFRTITALYRFRGDSLVVYDAASRRVSVFSPDGAFVRDRGLGQVGESSFVVALEGVLSDGTLVVGATVRANPNAEGYKRDTLDLALLSSSEVEPGRTDLGRFLEEDMVEHRTSPRPGIVNVQQGTIPFARTTYLAAGPDHVYVGTSDTYEVRVFGRDGSLVRSIRRPDRPPRPVTDEILDRFVDNFIRGVTSNRVRTVGAKPNPDAIRKTWNALPRVPSLPTHGEMLVDGAGDLWVEDYAMPWESDDPRGWSAYGPDGRLLGEVHTPAGLRVLDIGRDALLGLARDSLDVEHVQLWGLARR